MAVLRREVDVFKDKDNGRARHHPAFSCFPAPPSIPFAPGVC
jgi:hypothetical protein